jgi:hypothetical protein
VATWEDRLFVNPKKLAQEDPRFSQITAQKFIDVAASYGHSLPIVGQAPNQQWLDPRDLEQPAAPPETTPPKKVAKKPAKRKAPKTAKTEEATTENVPPPVEPLVAEKPVVRAKPEPKSDPRVPKAPANTPFTQGTMVGSPQVPSAPPKDAWATKAPDPVGEGIQVLKPGGKFRFGS